MKIKHSSKLSLEFCHTNNGSHSNLRKYIIKAVCKVVSDNPGLVVFPAGPFAKIQIWPNNLFKYSLKYVRKRGHGNSKNLSFRFYLFSYLFFFILHDGKGGGGGG